MTKIINADTLFYFGDHAIFFTNEDLSKYTKIIAQKEAEETLYVINKRVNHINELKKGYSMITLSEPTN